MEGSPWMFDRNVLPQSLFVPFDVSPLARARVAMHNSELEPDSDSLLDRYACTVSGKGETSDDRRTFYAERYGAVGRSPQGGGARVGTDFGYQVKGIGRTPLLAARQVDVAYATGDLPLGEAIREHVWGELLHRVLPFGAVRSAMVIDSGERCRRAGVDDGNPTLKRGLLVRQCALRPAHFIRAAYHQKPARLKIPADRIRVEEALRVLHNLLPLGEYSDESAPKSDVDRLLQGLVTFAGRLARQQAVARARRFMHGAITPSNLALDARWLDYDSTSRPPVYASCRHYTPGFWDDHASVYQVFDSLWFHICKYIDFPASMVFRKNSLVDLYHERFSEELRLAFLEPTGFPLELRRHLGPASLERARALGTLLVQLAKEGTIDPFPGEAQDMAGYGTYNLSRVMLVLAAADGEYLDRDLTPWMPPAGTRTRLATQYVAVRQDFEAAATTAGWPDGAMRRLTLLNARNLSRQLTLLNGPHLMRHIDQIVLPMDGDALRQSAHQLLDGLLRDVAVTFRDSAQEGRVVVGSSSKQITTYDARAGQWLVEYDGGLDSISPRAMLPEHLRAMTSGHEDVPVSLEEVTNDWYCP